MIIYSANYLAAISVARSIAWTAAAWIGVASDTAFAWVAVAKGAAWSVAWSIAWFIAWSIAWSVAWVANGASW